MGQVTVGYDEEQVTVSGKVRLLLLVMDLAWRGIGVACCGPVRLGMVRYGEVRIFAAREAITLWLFLYIGRTAVFAVAVTTPRVLSSVKGPVI